jgi:hypothetical protein
MNANPKKSDSKSTLASCSGVTHTILTGLHISTAQLPDAEITASRCIIIPKVRQT